MSMTSDAADSVRSIMAAAVIAQEATALAVTCDEERVALLVQTVLAEIRRNRA